MQVVYASSATELFEKDDLASLLQHSRENNARRDISGILLYKGGNFMQVLEGEASTVDALLDVISRDRRHKGVLRLLRRPIETRDFPDWSMAFRDLKDVDLRQHPGYSDFLNTTLTDPSLQGNDSKVIRLIHSFAKINR